MRVTLRDIAKRVNLSHATVSFILNGQRSDVIPSITRERVLKAAREMGYRPNPAARALKMGRTNMVALWLPLADWAQHRRAQVELANLAARDGFELVTRLFDPDAPTIKSEWILDNWPIDGALILDCNRPKVGRAKPMSVVPVVSAGTCFHPEMDHVGVDVSRGTAEAMRHLVDAACRRIAYLTCDDGSEPTCAAYLEECRALRLEPELVATGVCSRADARARVRKYVAEKGPPDAILAQRDELAIAAHRGLADGGYAVPRDVLIVGYDGSEEGECSCPSLTSIVQPYSDMCVRAWNILTERMRSLRDGVAFDATVRSQILEAKLEVRESSVRVSP